MCVTCDGSGWVEAQINLEPVLTRCYTCKRAGRPAKPREEFEVKPLPPHLVPFVRRAGADELIDEPLTLLGPGGGLVPKPNMYVRGWAISYLTGEPEHALQRLEAIYQAYGERGEPEQKEARRYDVAGATFRPCGSCRTPIAFVSGERGGKVPVERDGTPHFANCPESKEWRGTRRSAA